MHTPKNAVLRPGWEADLRRRYAEPRRVYHTFDHVLEVVDRWAEVDRDIGWEDPSSTWIAVLLHDVVYVVGRPDNEAQSAELVRPWCRDWVDGAVDTARVEALILATADHGAHPASESDTAHFLDCDLAVLGSTPERFARYEDAIRAEWEPVVGARAYADGRRRFLEKLAERPIFHTTYWRTRREEQARRNLAAALRVY